LVRPELTAYIEDGLRSAELTAVSSSAPTPYAREVIVAAARGGRNVAIVSNNSTPAIEAYLKAHHLFRYVDSIIGRPYAEPERMKPNPELLMTAARTLGHTVEQCLFVGDSTTDIFGANAAGMPVIGYANKPHKIDEFRQLGADQVVTSMASIAAALIDVGGG
ncbi:MAG TPA: HAD family phosphatase, partial [Micromonosporaceae bacterium]